VKEIINHIFTYPRIPKFAQASFDSMHLLSDKVMIVLLLIQWIISTFITSVAYNTYFYGFFGGAMIVVPLLLLYPYLKGDKFFRYFVAMAMMLFSVVFIQQYLGRIEMHFHVFIVMAILTLYKDIIPLIVAATTTLVHHVVFNYLQLYEVSLFKMPIMIFNYGCGFDIVILHAIFVVSELLVLGYLVRLQIEHTVDLNHTKVKVSALNEELEYTSIHDNLTGLPNRLFLNNEIEFMKEQADQNSTKLALMFLDLDHFKNINDTLGHDIGDVLLQSVSNIIRKNISKNDLVARIGGDEFILVISNVEARERLITLITKLLSEFRKELFIKGYTLRVSASIGVSIYPDDAMETQDLMKYADLAMYKTKANGRDNFSFFTQAQNEIIHTEVEMVNDMQRAFYDNEFKLYYQAKVDAKTEKIIGAEALIRWEHNEKGLIGPNQFISLAENTGFILNIGKFVIEESTQAMQRLRNLGFDDLIISINVSTRQFQNSDLYQDLQEAMKKSAIKKGHLAIEITEGILMNHLEASLRTLNKIKSLGIAVYLDDFGTGYSSLSYLKKFPIDTLKIDKSFIDDIHEDSSRNSAPLVNTIVAMGKNLGIHIVAEGVESKCQLEYLKAIDCDTIQGYYFSKPIPEAAFIELLRKQNS
jgi:diguanylate cyclase (GGDEF)-like protein